ncbi:MAG TPA: Asp/Glu racemase [Albitalea sp.]|nr:Asp/Glu racemase [Albitalea sp.]
MHSRQAPRRIGLIVPSSNTTLEDELPQLLRRQRTASGHGFSLHAARVRLQQLTAEALQRMNESAGDAVEQLCDAQLDAIVHGCLPAAMMAGVVQTQLALAQRAASARSTATLVTAARALLEALRSLQAKRITMITPYRRQLTQRLVASLREQGIEVVESRSLELVDNAAVGRLDPAKLLKLASQLDFSGSDALLISASAQMPSLPVIEEAEQRFGLPVLSAVTASAFELLRQLRIPAQIDGAGALLRQPAPSIGML